MFASWEKERAAKVRTKAKAMKQFPNLMDYSPPAKLVVASVGG